MQTTIARFIHRVLKPAFLAGFVLLAAASPARAAAKSTWWNPEWTIRKKITVDTAVAGGAAGDAAISAVVLIRLHDGNFQFAAAREDASDLRFVAADDKTPLSHHIEKYDGLLNEAFVWVKVPDLKSGGPLSFWLYYGNTGPNALRVEESKATFDADAVLVYHFAERNGPPKDSTGNANNAETPGPIADGSLIGSGLRLTGQNAVTIPKSTSLAWSDGQTLTWSAWIKPRALAANAVIFSRREDANAFLIGLDNGVPYVEVAGAGGTQRSAGGEPVAAGAWRHLAVVSSAAEIKVYLDGESYATLAVGMPALNTPALLGRDGTPGGADAEAQPGFAGDLDELQIAKTARSAAFLKLSAVLQIGGDKTAKALTFGADESSAHGGENEIAKHLSLIADISKSLTFDGWVVIGLCTLLAVVGWGVTLSKFLYLNRIKKASDAFLKQWQEISSDLTALDHGDAENIKSMGGKAGTKAQKLISQSPLFHLYHIGSEEIRHRLDDSSDDVQALSGRSIQAIRATLDGGLVREVQRLNSNIVFLTIGIAGGPYLGLLGTVIGVMITFAVIAKSGQVEVNSIAPGIAGALLATVAGLAVAIPALFAYSYISARIKDAISGMEIFINEFVAKIAEFYSEPSREEDVLGRH